MTDQPSHRRPRPHAAQRRDAPLDDARPLRRNHALKPGQDHADNPGRYTGCPRARASLRGLRPGPLGPSPAPRRRTHAADVGDTHAATAARAAVARRQSRLDLPTAPRGRRRWRPRGFRSPAAFVGTTARQGLLHRRHHLPLRRPAAPARRRPHPRGHRRASARRSGAATTSTAQDNCPCCPEFGARSGLATRSAPAALWFSADSLRSRGSPVPVRRRRVADEAARSHRPPIAPRPSRPRTPTPPRPDPATRPARLTHGPRIPDTIPYPQSPIQSPIRTQWLHRTPVKRHRKAPVVMRARVCTKRWHPRGPGVDATCEAARGCARDAR